MVARISRLPKQSPYLYYSLGILVLLIAVTAQLLVIVSNILFIRTNTVELLTYGLATMAVITIPVVQSLLGRSRTLLWTTLACYSYCALITIFENLKTAHEIMPHSYQVVLITSLTGDQGRTTELAIVFLVALSFIMIELLSRLSGAGVDLIIKGRGYARRLQNAQQPRRRRPQHKEGVKPKHLT